MKKNQIEEIVYEIISDISGLDIEELKELRETNLFESGIIDSLSVATVFSKMKARTNQSFSFKDFKVEDLSTLSNMIEAFGKKIK